MTVLFHRGPSAVEMENMDQAIATVSGLQVGTYHFRLTVKDQEGLSSTTTLTVAVKKGEWGQRVGGPASGGAGPLLLFSLIDPKPGLGYLEVLVFAYWFTADAELCRAVSSHLLQAHSLSYRLWSVPSLPL